MDSGQKISIGGIKFSEELVHLQISGSATVRLLRSIADAALNLPFLCYGGPGDGDRTSLCVRRQDFADLQRLLGLPAIDRTRLEITTGVGTITIFPHNNSLALIGLLLNRFALLSNPIHSLSTSISAIAINTTFILLDEIAADLQMFLRLPGNHAPFRQTLRVEQLSG